MVNYMLMISADLENLTNLQPQAGCDDPSFTYYFKVKCGNCGELSSKETCVSLNETVSIPKSRGTAHLLQRCKFCDREGTVTMIPSRGRPLTQEDCEAGQSAPLMMFDCRGFEPMGFAFGNGWKVESPSGSCGGKLGLGKHFHGNWANILDLDESYNLHSDSNRYFIRIRENMEKGCHEHFVVSGTTYDNVDLSAGEFAEYDEKGQCPLMISDLRATFKVVK